jgi:hypothetical protein
MAFAHELEHFIQWCYMRRVWAVNTLIQNLSKAIIQAEGLRWSDIPIEREARSVSKRTAERLFGTAQVLQFTENKIAEAADKNEKADWQYIRGLDASLPYDVTIETKLIFQRLKRYKKNFEEILQNDKGDPDFIDIDLAAYFV